MACCLTAPSYYLNQCWVIINGVLWHSADKNFAGRDQDINLSTRANALIAKLCYHGLYGWRQCQIALQVFTPLHMVKNTERIFHLRRVEHLDPLTIPLNCGLDLFSWINSLLPVRLHFVKWIYTKYGLWIWHTVLLFMKWIFSWNILTHWTLGDFNKILEK